MSRKISYIFTLLLIMNITANARSNSSSNNWTWYANDHFTLTQNEDEVKVEMKKKKWECFTLFVEEYDLKEHPKLELEIKTPSKINFRIDAIDQSNRNKTTIPIEQVINASDQYQKVIFNFDKIGDSIDSSRISQFQFFVNAGKDFIGSVTLKNIQLEQTTLKNTLSTPVFKVFPNPAEKSCRFSISTGNVDQVKISNCYGQVLITQMYDDINNHEIDLNKLNKGLYMVTALKQGVPVATKRLLIR